MRPWGLPISDHPSPLHHPCVHAGPVPERLRTKAFMTDCLIHMGVI